jgi:hypothetical protein
VEGGIHFVLLSVEAQAGSSIRIASERMHRGHSNSHGFLQRARPCPFAGLWGLDLALVEPLGVKANVAKRKIQLPTSNTQQEATSNKQHDKQQEAANGNTRG